MKTTINWHDAKKELPMQTIVKTIDKNGKEKEFRFDKPCLVMLINDSKVYESTYSRDQKHGGWFIDLQADRNTEHSRVVRWCTFEELQYSHCDSDE